MKERSEGFAVFVRNDLRGSYVGKVRIEDQLAKTIEHVLEYLLERTPKAGQAIYPILIA